MLLLQIIFTVLAWRKGWRARALLPMGLLFLLAFIVGAATASSGGSIEDIQGLLIFLDLVGLVALIVMSMKAPSESHELRYADNGTATEIDHSEESLQEIEEMQESADDHRY